MDDYLRVIAVRRPTKKGSTPLLLDTASGVLLTGYAAEGVSVAVGQKLPADLISWDRENHQFWVWLS